MFKAHPSAAVLGFFVTFIALVFVHQSRFKSPTPVSRLDCLHALISEGTLAVDRWRTNTPDLAFANGHYYSDKAPGTIVLALPGFLAGSVFLRASGEELESKRGWLITSWTACAGIALLTAWGMIKLASLLGALTRPQVGWLTTAAVWFGAAPLPYSTLLFSHAHVVACISLGLVALGRTHPETFGLRRQPMNSQAKAHRLALAGFALGWALNSEYTAGLVVVGILVMIIGRNWSDYGWVSLGMIGPLLLIPLYSWLTVGSPFVLPYSYQASFPEMKEGLYAIKWPDLATAFNLTFGPARGLFFWSPFLLCAFLGYAGLLEKSRRLFCLTYLVPVLHLAVISGRVWDWPAGLALGPRYLAPMLPLLALPCAFGVQKFPKLSLVAAAYSILITTVATLTNACPPYNSHPNPLFDFHVPLFLKGQFSPNLGTALGLPPFVSVALFYAILIGGTWCLWRNLPGKDARDENPA
ncbi:MAG: hypothetical protein HY674_06680 [Chloroflexi bacterium]|nr:hypothetical protein [Chloroflexota bacterium]